MKLLTSVRSAVNGTASCLGSIKTYPAKGLSFAFLGRRVERQTLEETNQRHISQRVTRIAIIQFTC